MSLQPPAQPQIVPWLIQPLPTLVWIGLGGALLATLAAAVRVRRSPEPCPFSPRWVAVTLVVVCGLLAAMAFGGGLVHIATAAAAAVLVVTGTAVAWAGWHTDTADKVGFAQATGFPFSLGVSLALAAVPLLYLKGAEWRMGINVGEALACLLPAAGTPLAVLFLLPPDHHRTQQARRSAFVFTAAVLASLTVAAAGATLAVSTPLPFESPLADRYTYVNATLATAAMLAGLCCAAVGSIGWLSRRWQGVAALACLLVGAFVLNMLCVRRTATPAFGQPAFRSVVSFACGLLPGLIAWNRIRWRPFARAVICVIAVVIAVRTAITAPAAAGSFAACWNAALAALGFFTAAVTARSELGSPSLNTARSFGEPAFVSSACVIAGMVAVVLAARSSLIYQSAEFSRHFHYDRLLKAGDDFRRESVGHPHALHMGGGRFSWVLPQATWWTSDYAWRDALIVTDRSKTIPRDAENTSSYYGVEIVDENGAPDGADFKDARHIAITQPVLVGKRSTVVQTVPVRTATLGDLAAWAALSASNPALWVGLVVLAGVLSWWSVRSPRPPHWAAIVFAAALLVAAAAEGLAAVTSLLAATAAAFTLASVRRDDRWCTPNLLGLLIGAGLLLLPLILRVGDRS